MLTMAAGRKLGGDLVLAMAAGQKLGGDYSARYGCRSEAWRRP